MHIVKLKHYSGQKDPIPLRQGQIVSWAKLSNTTSNQQKSNKLGATLSNPTI